MVSREDYNRVLEANSVLRAQIEVLRADLARAQGTPLPSPLPPPVVEPTTLKSGDVVKVTGDVRELGRSLEGIKSDLIGWLGQPRDVPMSGPRWYAIEERLIDLSGRYGDPQYKPLWRAFLNDFFIRFVSGVRGVRTSAGELVPFLRITGPRDYLPKLLRAIGTRPDEEGFRTLWIIANQPKTETYENVLKAAGFDTDGGGLFGLRGRFFGKDTNKKIYPNITEALEADAYYE